MEKYESEEVRDRIIYKFRRVREWGDNRYVVIEIAKEKITLEYVVKQLKLRNSLVVKEQTYFDHVI